MSKFDKMKSALAQKKEKENSELTERLISAENIANSVPNPLSTTPLLKPSVVTNQNTPSTFTRESEIVTVAKECGNKIPYFLRVSYDLIEPNPYNARVNYKPQRVHKMSLEIKADGQMVPGIATIRNGRFILAAGHYRWKGIEVANIGFMDLMIYEQISDRELYKLSYKENAERSDQTVLDNASAWRKLLNDGIYENESAIAEETGISLSNINKIISVLNLPRSVINYIEEQESVKFALSSLYELQLYSGVATEEATLEMVKKIVTDDYTRDQIKNARAALEKPKPPRKTKENSRQYKILDSDELKLIGHIKDFDSGKILLEINEPNDDKRKQILETLKLQFRLT
ncbi:ParB family chromosome partitioning protein [Undibacterium sp. GrIS 1.8]|uniref:ParB/RepB/Spo0J family partition protein n=1 Tax=unclassified Undibacterium TaxID=2630295 RepID=UPI0033914937